MNMTFVSFHAVGVYSKKKHALYISIMCLYIGLGKCLNMIGLKLSGPGDFLESNPLSALLTFSSDTVSLCIFHRSSFLTVFVLSYVVCFLSVCEGK